MLRSTWLPFVWILFVLWLIGGTYTWVCNIHKKCEDLTSLFNLSTKTTSDIPTSEEPNIDDTKSSHISRISRLKILNDGELFLESSDDIRFGKSDPRIVASSPILSAIDSLVLYLKENPSKRVRITGLYHESEENPSIFENLGVARAEDLGGLLIQNGLTTLQYVSSSSLNDSENFLNEQDTVIGGIALDIEEMPEKTLSDPRNFYFESNSNTPMMDEELVQYVQEVITFVEKNSDEVLVFIGHTDNDGEEMRNYYLGIERARKLARFFIEQGLTDNQAFIESKGENQPIATNETEEGKALNRRVEIQLRNIEEQP